MKLYPVELEDSISQRFTELRLPTIIFSWEWFKHLNHLEALLLAVIVNEYQPVMADHHKHGVCCFKKFKGPHLVLFPTSLAKRLGTTANKVKEVLYSLAEMELIAFEEQDRGIQVEPNLPKVIELSLGRLELNDPIVTLTNKKKTQATTNGAEAGKVFQALNELTPGLDPKIEVPQIKVLLRTYEVEDLVGCGGYVASQKWVREHMQLVTANRVKRTIGLWIRQGRPATEAEHKGEISGSKLPF